MFEYPKSKRKRLDHQKIQNASPITIDDEISPEEDDASVQMERYENLLKTLGCASDVLEDFYCRRQIKRGGGDSNDDVTDSNADVTDSESANASEAEVNKSDGLHSLKNDANAQRAQLHDEIIGEVGGEETADEDEIDDPNDVSDFQTGDHLLPNATKNNSYFHRHFGYVLTYDEVDKLTKEKLNFKWEMSPKEMIMSKLMGTGQDLSKELNENLFCGINEKLCNHWKNFYSSFNSDDSCSSKWRLFFSLCNTYRDIMYCDKRPFYLKGKEDNSSIIDAYLMHAINHIHKIREQVLKNDSKLNKAENSNSEEIYHGDVYLDQGFTRPKVMLLLPLASIAFRVVKRLVQLSPLSHKGNVAHMDRFSEEFGTDGVEGDKTTNESIESQKGAKPVDFQNLFGGNNNDHFIFGIKFTRRSIKLYSNFYSSDIIVASPLGLITKIGETEFDKEKNVDYLSSIEVLIIDHADIIAMQNWSHVSTVIEHLNHMPSKQHGTDVMRIKPWYLDGHARFYRQTILLGSLLTPDINALFNRLCVNYEGKVKLIEKHKGVLYKVLLQVRQVYERFEASSIIDTDGARIEYFSKKVFPKMKDSIEGGTLVFISSYFEFVRIRNFLKSQNASFCLLGEYTKQSDVSRSRLWFFEGKRKIMLYTERAHFYHRYKIRGIKNLIIYSLPERKEFYPEIVNMVEGSKNVSITVLFSRFDLFKLERIVGTAAAKRMNSSDKATFVFC